MARKKKRGRRRVGHITKDEHSKALVAVMDAAAICSQKYGHWSKEDRICVKGVRIVAQNLERAGFGDLRIAVTPKGTPRY